MRTLEAGDSSRSPYPGLPFSQDVNETGDEIVEGGRDIRKTAPADVIPYEILGHAVLIGNRVVKPGPLTAQTLARRDGPGLMCRFDCS